MGSFDGTQTGHTLRALTLVARDALAHFLIVRFGRGDQYRAVGGGRMQPCRGQVFRAA